MSSPPGHFISLATVARRLNVNRRSLQRWCSDGQFPHIRTPGGHFRVPVSALATWIAQNTFIPESLTPSDIIEE